MTSATPPTNDADRRRDEVVKRMIATPPQPKPKPPSRPKADNPGETKDARR